MNVRLTTLMTIQTQVYVVCEHSLTYCAPGVKVRRIRDGELLQATTETSEEFEILGHTQSNDPKTTAHLTVDLFIHS